MTPRRRRMPRASLLRRASAAGVAALLAGASLVLAPSASAAPDVPDPVPTASPAAGAYYPVPVQRLLGAGPAGAVPSAGAAIRPGLALRVPVLGRDGLPPTGVSAVVVNLTATAGRSRVALAAQPATGPLSAAFPEATPSGTVRATTALTAPALRTRSSLATVPLAPDGSFDLSVVGGSATVTADLVGLYAADDTLVARLGSTGGYQPSEPVRLLGPGLGAARETSAGADTATESSEAPVPEATATIDASLAGAVAARSTRRLALDLGEATTHVTALALRVSVVAPSADALVTVTAGPGVPAAPAYAALTTPSTADPSGDPSAGSSPAADTTAAASAIAARPTVTTERGSSTSNLAVVPAVVDADGLLSLAVTSTAAVATDVRVDLVGFYDDGRLGPDLRFRALPPSRVLDTRTTSAGALAAAARTLAPSPDVVGDNTFALVGAATVLSRPGRATELRLDPDGDPVPVPAPGGLPVSAADQATTAVQPEVGASGALTLTSSAAPVDVVLDVVGSMEAYPPVTDPTTRGWVHAVPAWQVRALAR